MRLNLNREWLIIVGLLLFVALLRLPSLGQPFENDSSALAYHARLITRGEPLYGTHHTGHHMPGAYYTYVAAFELFGDRVQSVRALLMLWTAVTVYLIYRIGRIAANRFVGLTAAITAALLYIHPEIAGNTTRIENFLGLPQTAAVLTLFYLIKKQSKPWLFLWVGFFIGVTFLFKVNNILSPLGVAGIAILVEFWQNKSWRIFLLRCIWLGVGFVVALLPAFLFFGIQGLLPRWLLIFTFGFAYSQIDGLIGLTHPIFLLLFPLARLGRANPIIIVSGLAGTIILIWKMVLAYKQRTAISLIYMGYIGLWFLLCFIETSFSRIFIANYYLIYVPPLTLLATWFWYELYQDNQTIIRIQSRWVIPILLGIIFIPTLFLGIRDNIPYYIHYYLRYLPGQESYDEVLAAGMPEEAGDTLQFVRDISSYLDAHSEPSDTIYYWSNVMELYYTADRRSAKDIIWPLYVSATGPPEEVLTATYIVLGKDIPFGFAGQPDWLKAGLETQYELEATLHGQAIYHRLLEGNQ